MPCQLPSPKARKKARHKTEPLPLGQDLTVASTQSLLGSRTDPNPIHDLLMEVIDHDLGNGNENQDFDWAKIIDLGAKEEAPTDNLPIE